MSDCVLCIFARAPVPGRVKTRLADSIGPEAACRAHVDLVENTLSRLSAVPGLVTELWVDDAADPAAGGWARRWGLPLRAQGPGDLGARMHRALLSCLAEASSGIVVGTDCPDIDAGCVHTAAGSLADHDLVVVPAVDGGYGLIGLRGPAPDLFRDIPWGSGQVLEATLDAAARAGLSVARLAEIHDVDTVEDWQRYLAGRQ